MHTPAQLFLNIPDELPISCNSFQKFAFKANPHLKPPKPCKLNPTTTLSPTP